MKGGEDGPAVVSGKSVESTMIKRMLATDPDEQTPPKGKRVPAEQIALLLQWIDEGLALGEGFALKKPAYEPPHHATHQQRLHHVPPQTCSASPQWTVLERAPLI